VLHTARCKCRTQKIAKKSPSGHHRTTLSRYIFANKARIDNRKKLVKQRYLPHMYSMAHFRPTTADILSLVWGNPANFNGFCLLAALLHGIRSSSGRQQNFAALNRGGHLYSAGRSSRWAMAHMLVLSCFFFFSSHNLSGCGLDVYHTSTHGVALVRT